jgi:GDPmannose 4,6-dehydratase
MYQMMQTENPDKFVIATGVTRSLLDFAKTAFSCVGITDNVLDYVEIDSSLFRVSDVSVNRANPIKANSLLNWYPSISFGDMIHEMVSVDLLENR